MGSSSSDGWSRRYDGGTRLAVFNVLVETSKNDALKMFYDAFADETPLDYETFQHLLPILATDKGLRKGIGEEIELHVTELIEGCATERIGFPRISISTSSFESQFEQAAEIVFGRG